MGKALKDVQGIKPFSESRSRDTTRFGTMTTIELPVSPLPRPPPPHNQWGHYWPDYLRAYNTVLDAERHADEQVETNPSNREAKDDVMFSRLVGFLLLEFFDRRAILSERPCASLAKQIESVPRGGTSHEVVFEVGKWYWDRWICMCAFDHFLHHSVPQFPCRPEIPRGIPDTLTSFESPPFRLR